MRPLLFALLLLTGCGDGEDEPEVAPDTEQIRNVSTPEQEEPDPQASARLQPITMADIEQQGLLGAGCQFSSAGDMLVAAAGSDAIARIGGELIHLVHSSAMGPSGGFFEDRQLSISVGRTSQEGAPAEEATTWPARATVTNRRTEAQVDLTGTWTCGA